MGSNILLVAMVLPEFYLRVDFGALNEEVSSGKSPLTQTAVKVKTLMGLSKVVSFLDAEGLKRVLTACPPTGTKRSRSPHAPPDASTLERDSDPHPLNKKLKLASEPDGGGKILEKPDPEFAVQLLSSLAHISEGIQVLIPKGKVPLPNSDPLWDLYGHCWMQKLEPVRPEEGQLPVPLPFYKMAQMLPFMGGTNGYLLIRKVYETIADSILKGVKASQESNKSKQFSKKLQGILKIVLQPSATKELAACAYYTSHFKLSNLYKAATTKEQRAAALLDGVWKLTALCLIQWKMVEPNIKVAPNLANDPLAERYWILSDEVWRNLYVWLHHLREASVARIGYHLCEGPRTCALGGLFYEQFVHTALTQRPNQVQVWDMQVVECEEGVYVKVTGTLKPLAVPKLKVARYDSPVTNVKSSRQGQDFKSKIIWMVVPKYIKNATLGPIKIPKTVTIRKIDIELEEEGGEEGEEDKYPVGRDYEEEEDKQGEQEEASAEGEEEAKTAVTAAQEDHPAVSPSSPEAPDSVKSAASLLARQFEFHLVVIPWKHVKDGPESFGLR
ncbi:hypothetical protein C8J56DRAFT_900300 [Mycena floridula]|nr:hypothetical protein C8J56DRAFT_900300 [Mycena floridula]